MSEIDIQSKLPENINDYKLRFSKVNDFTVIEYSKKALFMRYYMHSPQLHNEVPENLLYEVKSTNTEDAYDQMQARVNLNKRVETDFENKLRFKLDTIVAFQEPKEKYEFLMMTFDCYLIVDTETNTKFFVVVSTNLKQDLPALPRLLYQLKQNLLRNENILTLPPHLKEIIKSSVFTKLVHLYTKNVIHKPEITYKLFKKRNNWKVIIKDPDYFKQHAGELHRKLIENRIILCENQNAEIFNQLEITHTKFSSSVDSFSLFYEIRTQDVDGLRDRDYLTDGEISRLRQKFPNYFILEYYCIENYLYHPDNIASLGLKEFNKQEYIKEIIKQKKNSYEDILINLKPSRSGYNELKFSEINKSKHPSKEIKESLKSDDLEQFYKYFDMKNKFNKSILEPFNITQERLCNTKWFKSKILDTINP